MPDASGVLQPHSEAARSRQYVAEIEANVLRQQERHIAERFARAMELLGDEKLEVRWGGIFALERIARLSPQDQSTVVEVLSTYLRRRAAWKIGSTPVGSTPVGSTPVGSTPGASIETETQLIVTVLGRRKWPFKGEDRPLDLHGTNLSKAHLPFAHLESAFLYDCNLESALLFRANLQCAWLARARLKNANFDGANLQGADLSDAVGLTEEQLKRARMDEKTVLPSHLLALRLHEKRR